MNDNQFELKQTIYPSLDLQPNSISSPSLSNPTTQNSDYSDETDNQIISNLLLKYIEQNNPKDFRNTLSTNSNLLSKKTLENIFLFILSIYISGKIYASRFLSILIPLGINPNIILNQINYNIEKKDNKEEYNPTQSILMLFCSKSNFTIISNLCESKIKLDVNYLDMKKRNALFYLKGGSEDKKIIELLIEKGININQRDIEGNTPLHHALINNLKKEFIYYLIDIGNANFMIKNNQNNNCVELINQKWISKNNLNYHKSNLIDFKDIKDIIELLKRKLSIKLYENPIILNDNNGSKDELIKLPSNIFNKSNNNNNEEINENENDINLDNNNIYLRLTNKPSLIIDTQFNDEKNNISTSKKIEYYKQLNEDKKNLINLLKKSENFLIEKSKLIKEEIESKKNKLDEVKNYLNSKIQTINIINEKQKKERIKKNAELLEIKKKIDFLKNKIKSKEKNIINIEPKSNFFYKYEPMIIRNKINYESIYTQLKIDLLDYMEYVYNKNEKLKNTILSIKQLLKESVNNCLGKNYEVKIYGSRETGLCLPWSDIDAVISFTENEYIQPLHKLYIYLQSNYSFIDIKYIENTQIPLIKIITSNEFYNISLDISLELPEHHGAECVTYIKEKIKEYEVLSPMTLAFKTIFQKAKINDPYTGGLSSYGIILLIIYFLKINQKNGNDISLNNLGKLFYKLLEYYGTIYNVNDPIDINENDRVLIENIHFNGNTNGLIIIDPLNIYNNVAKNMRQFINIRFALCIALACINESCECGCHYQYEGICIKEDGCEHNILNNIFNSVNRNLKI